VIGVISRSEIAYAGLNSTARAADVRSTIEAIFKHKGLPEAVRSDNGFALGSSASFGRSPLRPVQHPV
jgi:hypothetical protein